MQPYAVIEVTRTTRVIRHGVSTIQVAFDVGAARAGGRDEPICELELELTDGRLGDVLALAATLPLGPELRWSVLSKSERANRLAGAAAVVVPRAGRPGLRPSMTAVNGIRTIGWACLQHLLAAYEAVLANGDEEAIHQTRVATRRLRTAIGLLMKREGGERARVLLRELQAAARCLGQVRDIDVLIARLGDQRSATRTELIGGLRRSRDRACSAACAMLSGSQFQQLLVELARWVEDGSWNRAPSVRAVRIDSFSARWLNRLSRKLRKQAEGLAELADADLHRVRKTAKKLRYLAEFTGAAFPRATSQRARRKSVASLTEVQDSLGRIQDQIAAAQMAKALFEGEDVLTRARLEEELRLAEVSAIGRKHCLKVARHGLRSAFDAMPWWSAG